MKHATSAGIPEALTNKRVQPALVAARFAAASLAAGGISNAAFAAVGLPALVGPPIAWSAAGIWAAGGLRLTWLARLGYGLTLAGGAFSSLMAVVSTQAWPNLDLLPIVMPTTFSAGYGVAAAVGLLTTLPSQTIRFYARSVAAFAMGGFLAGLVVAIAPLTLTTTAIALIVPPVTGAFASARARQSGD